MMTKKKETPYYDVCIVGAGPAALASLSAIKTHYSLDTLNDQQVHRATTCMHREQIAEKRVCVVDAAKDWMTGWQKQFAALDISFLRSPTLAHPDMFDKNALLAYAVKNGREDELLETGCLDMKTLLPLGESQIGLWKLPSSNLFLDFCLDLSKQLAHDYIQGSVVDIKKDDFEEEEDDDGETFQVTLDDGTQIQADSVILAVGTTGRPIVPRSIQQAPANKVYQWTQLDRIPASAKNVLVIGGGLTAVQSAERVLKQNLKSRCVLCSRRDLVERHFDLSVDWFDRRTSTKCMADFYHLPIEERLGMLKESRGGGSVPPIYLRSLRRLERVGRLQLELGDARFLWEEQWPNPQQGGGGGGDRAITRMAVSMAGERICHFDAIVLACGVEPDCTRNSLIKKLVERWPIDIVGGFPSITEDLKWTTDKLFVVGRLGSLNIGPDAGNLMGIRRAAQTVANSLDCRCWMRKADVLSNRFEAFLLDDETDSDDSDVDEE